MNDNITYKWFIIFMINVNCIHICINTCDKLISRTLFWSVGGFLPAVLGDFFSVTGACVQQMWSCQYLGCPDRSWVSFSTAPCDAKSHIVLEIKPLFCPMQGMHFNHTVPHSQSFNL